MKRITLLFIMLLAICFKGIAQIKKLSLEDKGVKSINTEPYDSLKNFLGSDVYKYIGQELYLKRKGKGDRELGIGYSGFFLDYKKGSYPASNVYKCCSDRKWGGSKSNAEELENKYFTVIDVVKNPEKDIFLPVKYF